MFEVFTAEIEATIKEGLTNLYWYRADLQSVWLRAGAPQDLTAELFQRKSPAGQQLTKRELMEHLYLEVREWPDRDRLELSRNFVRTLLEHQNFVPQHEHHRVERAQHAALLLREIVQRQEADREKRDRERRAREAQQPRTTDDLPSLHEALVRAMSLRPQPRGYELERLFTRLMRLFNIEAHEPFKIVGEQIDGAIKYEGHYYLVELRWREEKADQQAIAGLYLKVEGKLEARGLFVSMNGYSDQVLQSLPRGKEIKVLLLDGQHLANVLSGTYSLPRLLNHAIAEASCKANIYCSHDLCAEA